MTIDFYLKIQAFSIAIVIGAFIIAIMMFLFLPISYVWIPILTMIAGMTLFFHSSARMNNLVDEHIGIYKNRLEAFKALSEMEQDRFSRSIHVSGTC